MEKDYLSKKWLNNNLNAEEEKAFELLEESELSQEIISEAKRFKLQHPHKVISFQELEKQLPINERKSWLGTALKIAAVFVIALGTFFYLNQENDITYQTEIAQKELVTLPDNSLVTLNNTSTLVFNPSNWEKQRNVELKGEAFFDVEKGKIFDVKTTQGTIRVVGTEFTVTDRDSIFRVNCYEGMVEVIRNNKTTQLPAGKSYLFSNTESKVVELFLAEPKWLQGLSVFENANISKVLKEVEKEYDIQINDKEIDPTIQFTGAFENNNLKNALQQITQSLNLTYEIVNDKTVIIRNATK